MLQVVHTIEDWFYERRPKIVVFSAVGGEGFAVASAVLSQSRKPQVVAVVKEENHAKAQALKSQGALLALDPLRQDWTEEEELVERVAEVLKESTGAYFVAEGDSAAQDQAAAKVYAAAAYKAGVRHVIWSTMEDTCTIVEPSTTSLPLVDGYRVPDFDGKGRGEKYFTEAGLKTMFLLTSFPYEELVAYPFCLPHYSPAGQRLRVMLPFEERVPMMSWKDVGRLAVSIFRWGSYGRTSLCGDRLGGEQIAEVFSTLLREDVEFEYLPVDAFETLVPPKTTRQALMFRYFQECNEVAHKIRETTTLRDPLSFAAFCKTGTIHMGSEGNSKEIKLAHKLALQRKLIVVFGATGQQGNAVAKALLAANFGVRCVTRRPNCAEAKDLRDRGAEIMPADMTKKAELAFALKGAYGAFFVTFFWDHFDPHMETMQAKMFAEASGHLHHAVWSTAENTRQIVLPKDSRLPLVHGKYRVPPFDGKGRGDTYFTDLGVPTTFLMPGIFYESFLNFHLGPRRKHRGNPDRRPVLSLPIKLKQLPLVAVQDVGRIVAAIFQQPRDYVGKYVPACAEHLNADELVQHFTTGLNTKVRFEKVDFNVYSAHNTHVLGSRIWTKIMLYAKFYNQDLLKRRDPAESRRLVPEMLSFADWVSQHQQEIETVAEPPDTLPDVPPRHESMDHVEV